MRILIVALLTMSFNVGAAVSMRQGDIETMLREQLFKLNIHVESLVCMGLPTAASCNLVTPTQRAHLRCSDKGCEVIRTQEVYPENHLYYGDDNGI